MGLGDLAAEDRGRQHMILARRWVCELLVLAICIMPCAATGDVWRHRGDVHSNGRASEAETPSSALTGRWEGTWHSSRVSAGGALTALFTQSDASLTGEVTIFETACLSAGTVSGAVEDDTVIFGAVFADAAQAKFEGTVIDGGMAIEGVYDVTTGKCKEDGGTWRIAKIVDPCDANGDGTIDRQDTRDLLKFLLGAGPALSGNTDCNQDGVVNFSDVIAIFKSQ